MVVLYSDHSFKFPLELLTRVEILSVTIFEVTHFHDLKVVDLLDVLLNLVAASMHLINACLLKAFHHLDHLIRRNFDTLLQFDFWFFTELDNFSFDPRTQGIIIAQILLHSLIIVAEVPILILRISHHLLYQERILFFYYIKHFLENLAYCCFRVVYHRHVWAANPLLLICDLVEHLHDDQFGPSMHLPIFEGNKHELFLCCCSFLIAW